MNEENSKNQIDIKPIRFYCRDCGKEILKGFDLEANRSMSIGWLLDKLVCDDCLDISFLKNL